MAVLATENMTVWLSLANTLFASLAFILWYFAIWQEEEEKLYGDNIIIIDADDHRKCDNDGNHAKHEADNSDAGDEEVKSNEHLYVCPGLRNGDNTLNYCDYYQNTTKQGVIPEKYAQDDIKQTKCVKAVDADAKNIKITTVEHAYTKNTKHADGILAPSAQPHIKATLTLPKKATFQWPKHENTIEQLRSAQPQSRAGISQEVLDKLQSLGIMRASVQPPSAQTASDSVRVSDSARVSAKLCGNKQVRIAWDNFMAKSRPGLDLDCGNTRQTNYKRKNKNKNLSKAANTEKPTKSFFPLIRPDNCTNFVRAV